METNQYKVLVVGPSWIGDMVMAQCLFQSLHQQINNLHLSVLAPEWSLPLVRRMPEVNSTIPTSFKHGRFSIRDSFGIARRLRSENFNRAIVLPRSLKSAIVPFLASIPTRTGFLVEIRFGLINDARQIDNRELPRTVVQFIHLGNPIQKPSLFGDFRPALTTKPSAKKKIFDRLGLQLSDKPALAICPGAAFGPAKRWPIEKFAEVARLQLKKGWQIWLMGSNQDSKLTKEISDLKLNDIYDLAGRTSLEEAVDLLSAASYVVSNDSGLMHVAAAVDTPIIAIYGSTSPRINPPLSPQATVLWKNLSCSPCNQRTCPLVHTDCLQKLHVDCVTDVLSSYKPSSLR